VFVIGFLSGTEVSIDVGPVMERRIRVQGNKTGPVADLADAAAAMTALAIKPVLDATFPMDQAQDAYKHVEAGGHFGKVVISIP
jgi:NADPH:quinone reductase-like Zn-dependent oxidoreductase